MFTSLTILRFAPYIATAAIVGILLWQNAALRKERNDHKDTIAHIEMQVSMYRETLKRMTEARQKAEQAVAERDRKITALKSNMNTIRKKINEQKDVTPVALSIRDAINGVRGYDKDGQ